MTNSVKLQYGNSVDKQFCCVEWKIISKTFSFIDFYNCHTLFSPWTPLPTRLVLNKIFAYPSNKRVIYGLELNV